MKKNRVAPRDFSGRARGRKSDRWSSLFSSQRFLAIVLLVFLLIIIFPLIKTYRQHRAVEQEIKDVQKQINDYQAQDQQFKKMLAYLKSDQYLVDQARTNMNMKKPGEGVIVIDNKKTVVASTTAVTASAPVGNLAKWWRYFFY